MYHNVLKKYKFRKWAKRLRVGGRNDSPNSGRNDSGAKRLRANGKVGETTRYPAVRLLLFICPLFPCLQCSKIELFVTLFSGTVRPKKFKFGTVVDNGWMYRVYQNQAAVAYLSLYFFIFLSLQLSNIYNFRHIFLRNCEA